MSAFTLWFMRSWYGMSSNSSVGLIFAFPSSMKGSANISTWYALRDNSLATFMTHFSPPP